LHLSKTIVATATIQPEEPTDPEEGERLFHSQMWVNGTPLHFIVDSGSQKNLISVEVVKQLGFSTIPHPQPYNIGWLHQGRDLRVNQQCRLSYGIQHFKDEVLCDVSPLDVCDVLLGQPYMWKCHIVYESRLFFPLFIYLFVPFPFQQFYMVHHHLNEPVKNHLEHNLENVSYGLWHEMNPLNLLPMTHKYYLQNESKNLITHHLLHLLLDFSLIVHLFVSLELCSLSSDVLSSHNSNTLSFPD
jgi:hypothetical protein